MIENKLTHIKISGFKSLKDISLTPGNINVFIGPNASGKSNFIQFFRMLSFMLDAPGHLQEFVGRAGGAGQLIFLNRPDMDIQAELEITTPNGYDEYKFVLGRTLTDTLYFKEEAARFTSFTDLQKIPERRKWFTYGSGHLEPKLLVYKKTSKIAEVIAYLFRNLNVYQFHNTAENSYFRSRVKLTDNLFLRANGANLPAVLYKIEKKYPVYYKNIILAVRQVIPEFDTFVLEPEFGSIFLRWKEVNSDYIFDASQASDGFLRLTALITLLLQPEDLMPEVIFIDEPELGLHPEAIEYIASLMRKISRKRQLFISTQSPLLVNQFEADQVIITEKSEGATRFYKLDAPELSEWLKEYSLGELWLKNIIGGNP